MLAAFGKRRIEAKRKQSLSDRRRSVPNTIRSVVDRELSAVDRFVFGGNRNWRAIFSCLGMIF